MIKAPSKEEIEQERELFCRAWEFLVKYYNIEQTNTDEEWEAFKKDSLSLSEMDVPSRLGRNYLAERIAIALTAHIGSLSKERAMIYEKEKY